VAVVGVGADVCDADEAAVDEQAVVAGGDLDVAEGHVLVPRAEVPVAGGRRVERHLLPEGPAGAGDDIGVVEVAPPEARAGRVGAGLGIGGQRARRDPELRGDLLVEAQPAGGAGQRRLGGGEEALVEQGELVDTGVETQGVLAAGRGEWALEQRGVGPAAGRCPRGGGRAEGEPALDLGVVVAPADHAVAPAQGDVVGVSDGAGRAHAAVVERVGVARGAVAVAVGVGVVDQERQIVVGGKLGGAAGGGRAGGEA